MTKYYPSRFHMLADLVPGKNCVEVGVRAGKYAAAIRKHKPRKLFLVDIWHHQTSEVTDGFEYVGAVNAPENEQQRLYKKVCRMFEKYTNVKVIREWSHKAAEQFDNESLDFVYIDANHAADACYNDIKLWVPKLRKGGWMCGHDYLDVGIKDNGAEVTSKLGVDRYLQENGLELDLITNIRTPQETPREGVSPSWGFKVR